MTSLTDIIPPKPIWITALLMLGCSHGVAAKADVANEGVTAFTEGRLEAAKEYFVHTLEQSNDKNLPLMYLSRIHLELGDADKALQYAEKALETEPTDAKEVVLAGDIYCHQAQQASMFSALKLAKKCIGQYEDALLLDPENVRALTTAIHFYLGAPAIAGGSDKKGHALLERLAELSPEHADSIRVKLLDGDGQHQEAVELADQLNERGFEWVVNQYQIARFYKDKELYDKAGPLFKSLSSRQATPETRWRIVDRLLQLGEVYIAEGKDIQQGIDYIHAYRERNNNPHDVHYYWATWSLAKGYKALGQTDEYMALVKQIQSEYYEQDKAFAKEFESSI